MPTTFFVYILSCSDGSYYIGYTSNLEKRVHDHNCSKNGAKYTKSRRPVKLVYSEECRSKSDALKREIALKKLSRAQKEKMLKSNLIESAIITDNL